MPTGIYIRKPRLNSKIKRCTKCNYFRYLANSSKLEEFVCKRCSFIEITKTNKKLCSRCNVLKDLSQFPKRMSRKFKCASHCLDCDRIIQAKKRTETEHKLKHIKSKKEYNQRHPERIKARNLASKHREKLIKFQCERCGSKDNLHLHHPDYSKPLEVITLCIRCHEGEHHRK